MPAVNLQGDPGQKLQPATRRRPAVLPMPGYYIFTRPKPLPRAALVTRPGPAAPPLPRTQVLRPPPPAQAGVFAFRFRPTVARLMPAPPTQRPSVGSIPPRPQSVFAQAVLAPRVVPSPLPPRTSARAQVLKRLFGHLAPGYLVRATVVRLDAFPGPRPWPRGQCAWNVQTHRPVFVGGPRFTIADPGTSVVLASRQGVTFVIADPGAIAVFHRS
jgi:hypothetical protein